jgi:uncharacterized protein YecT (DUF1311 family)
MFKYFLFFCLTFVTINSFAQTQLEMNEEAYRSYKKVDDELGIVYKKILTIYAKNIEFINALKASERLWIQFRDAELKMMYPAADKSMAYGSMFPMCVNYYMEELTAKRVEQLKTWIKPVRDGESCTGSIGNFEPY